MIRLALVGSTGCLLSAGRVARPATIGSIRLDVRGTVTDILLVDPHGRADRYDNNIEDAQIPGCDRWPGGMETDLDKADAPNADSIAAAITSFEMDSVECGRYVIRVRAANSEKVTLTAVLDPVGGNPPCCLDAERTERVAPGLHAWTMEVRRSTSKGNCCVLFAPLPPRQARPRH